MSPTTEGPGVMSPTQPLLSEEILRQEEKKSHKLIIRELRKRAKSKSIKSFVSLEMWESGCVCVGVGGICVFGDGM